MTENDDSLRAPDSRPDDAPADTVLKEILGQAKKIAVIGGSSREGRPAHDVPVYLTGAGYDVTAVNPNAIGSELFGNPVVGSLAELGSPVDIVEVFRPRAEIPSHLPAILALSPLPKVVWFQLGLRSDETAAALRERGVTVIQDRCMKIEHRRLLGNEDGGTEEQG